MLFCERTLEVIGLFSIRPSVYGLRSATARYNVNGARQRASPLKVFAMWYSWSALLLVLCTLVRAEEGTVATETTELATTETTEPATIRTPPRTLDRPAIELAWQSWLQSSENGNQNAPSRRITTKSLFITPLNCPEGGERLDRNGCHKTVTVNKEEHERILLEQLNAQFTSSATASNGDIIYDYGDNEPGPLQLSIPISLDPLAAPLQGQEPFAQAQQQQPNYVDVNKKGTIKPTGDVSIEAELELLKLQNSHNNIALGGGTDILNHNVMTNIVPIPEKPKRDSSAVNDTEISTSVSDDQGQKEQVYGHVDVDPILYKIDNINQNKKPANDPKLNKTKEEIADRNNTSLDNTNKHISGAINKTKEELTSHILKSSGEKSKLNPENEYSDIGEAIKLISRYADVTTDDNFAKTQKKESIRDDSVLGTRTKLQHRLYKPKPLMTIEPVRDSSMVQKDKISIKDIYPNGGYYRYPWPEQRLLTPPPNYPFRNLQDYWPGRQVEGLYAHENPRRHHHFYPHKLLRARSYIAQNASPEQLKRYIHRMALHHGNAMRSNTNNQDLYSLLGLRHWFSSEDTSKR